MTERKTMSFAQWWLTVGTSLVYDELTPFEIAQRAWLESQSIQIRNNNKESN